MVESRRKLICFSPPGGVYNLHTQIIGVFESAHLAMLPDMNHKLHLLPLAVSLGMSVEVGVLVVRVKGA